MLANQSHNIKALVAVKMACSKERGDILRTRSPTPPTTCSSEECLVRARRHSPLPSPADQPSHLATVSMRINKAHSGYSLGAVNPSEEVTHAFPRVAAGNHFLLSDHSLMIKGSLHSFSRAFTFPVSFAPSEAREPPGGNV